MIFTAGISYNGFVINCSVCLDNKVDNYPSAGCFTAIGIMQVPGNGANKFI